MLQHLSETLCYAKDSNEVKGLIITGKGKAFCAGADISYLATCDAIRGYEFAKQGQSVFRQFELLGKPSLAALNGFTFGGGAELAMATSLRIAAKSAQFGQPEIKLGVIPGYGGTQRLARLVGKGRALDLCLTGRFISSEVLLSWGLVTEVVEDDALVSRAEELMTQIVTLAPLALESILEVIDHGYDMNLTDALHLEAVHFGKICATEDKTEGVSAFLEKRKAQFKGN